MCMLLRLIPLRNWMKNEGKCEKIRFFFLTNIYFEYTTFPANLNVFADRRKQLKCK